ncbi:alpha-hydroxy acid oxidase [Taylorella asinigenitalis]|uniref:L-lactate dehydrogenase n=1 Tax=Taylorella asinigenitalis (strain MCE3) TaxID=1008459 RepID=G4Q9E3_TAYAM|nr:alpha-hydroxy acid oxidase [Taylorella asinigenitalis]AEP36480.1 L-lactate dehydrogenase [Taylorella asinigenitalis MCE3]
MEYLKKITSIEDLRKIAATKVPKMFFEYADHGSYTESTYRANESDLSSIKFRQKVAVNIANRSTKASLLGEEYAMPVALAPVGICGMQRADGEILSAQAAEEFGVPFTLSTVSCASIEDVAANTKKPFWFQLYMMKDRGFMADLIQRAKQACSALVVTLDLQVLGQRHNEVKNGMTVPPKPTLPNLLNLATKPDWCWRMLHTKRRFYGNLVGHVKGMDNVTALSEWTARQFDATLNWKDLDWIANQWGGKIILKGIMDPGDAIEACNSGADAFVVSNHGGRQLDGALSTIKALPPILEAVDRIGSTTEVWIDGGFRSGQDILRAYAMGADGVMIGRPYIYGLGAYGKDGVSKALDIMQKELSVTMGFCGITDLSQASSDILYIPEDMKLA